MDLYPFIFPVVKTQEQIGNGVCSFQIEDPVLSAELTTIYTNVQKILDLRHKYLRVSLQGHADNPKDDPSWKIYPPPPPPVWVEDPFQRPVTSQGNESGAATWGTNSGELRPRTEKEGRKPGHDIGEDFVLEECEIPGEDEMEFKLDEQGVYQVYENRKGEFLFLSTLVDFLSNVLSMDSARC